jgi:uncharacterized protein (TIGR00369 family)
MTHSPQTLPAEAENISRGGFNAYAGPFWRLPPDGDIHRFALLVEPKHMNGSGALHGGVLMTFADIAMSQASRTAGSGSARNTVALTCDFVGPGKLGDIVEARVRVTRKTRSMIFLSADIVAGKRVLAVATGLWKFAER